MKRVRLAEVDVEDKVRDRDDARQHSELLAKIAKIGEKDKQSKLQRMERTEPSLHESLYTFSDKSAAKTQKKLTAKDLIDALQPKAAEPLRKQLSTAQRRTVRVKTSLSESERAKAERVAAYQRTKRRLNDWRDNVEQYRLAQHLEFPLDIARPLAESSEQSAKRFVPQNDLEREVADILKEGDQIKAETVLTEGEQRLLKALSVEEARRRRAELLKYKALLSYEEQKLRRQARIKSKTYRRFLRKQKQKAEKRTKNTTRNDNAEGNAEPMDSDDDQDGSGSENEVERAVRERALERATLRHRKSTSKFAVRSRKIGGRPNEQTREQVTAMGRIGRSLTQRVDGMQSDAESDSEDRVEQAEASGKADPVQAQSVSLSDLLGDAASQNPWLSNPSKKATENESEDFMEEDPLAVAASAFRKPPAFSAKHTTSANEDKDSESAPMAVDTDARPVDQPKAVRTPSVMEPTQVVNAALQNARQSEAVKLGNEASGSAASKSELALDKRMTISEAFADDHVVAEFEEEKQHVADVEQPKAVDLRLAGWGAWAGPGGFDEVASNPRLRKRFVVEPEKRIRRDAALRNVIIRETADRTIRKYQLSSLPFPYSKVSELEASLRLPLGREWNTELAFKRLVQPTVAVKLGAVIEPLDATLKPKRAEAAAHESDAKKAKGKPQKH